MQTSTDHVESDSGYIPPFDRAFLTVSEACQVLGMRTTKFYRKKNGGQIRTVLDGGRRLVPVAAIREYIDNIDAAARPDAR